MSFPTRQYMAVVAIDFGTTFSGFAFSFNHREGERGILVNDPWGNDQGFDSLKTPTCLLLDPEKRFHSFGFDAREKYAQLEETQDIQYYFFDHFKMELYKKGGEQVEMYFKYSPIPESETHMRDADIKSITDSISAYLIRTSNSVDIRNMKEDVVSELTGMYPPDKKAVLLEKLSLKRVQDFISDCCKLAWQLVVQVPSMHIQYNEKKFDQTKHDLANRPSTSEATGSKRIRLFLWPTLLDKKNGIVVCKGIVVTGDE